jgi:hypothetical protein
MMGGKFGMQAFDGNIGLSVMLAETEKIAP